MAVQFALVAMGSAMRGTGQFKPSMVIQTSTVILNIILAPFLIFGWITGHPLGVAGAALVDVHRGLGGDRRAARISCRRRPI